MATVGTIQVILSAQTAALAKGLKRGAMDIRGFTGQISGMFSGATGGFGGITSALGSVTGAAGPAGLALLAVAAAAASAVAAGYGLYKLVAPVLETADAAFKLATALRMPTDALMGLQQMARKEADLGADDFNAILNKFNLNLGKAAGGTGPAVDAFNSLGLSAQRLTALSLDQAFLQVADAVAAIQNPAQQAAYLTDIFGKSGQALRPMFVDGAAGIQAAIDQARQFGTALSDLDAAKLSAAKDGFEEVGQRIEGVRNQLAIALSPVLIEIGNQILDLIPSADVMRSAFVTGIHWVAAGVAFLIDTWYGFKAVVLTVATASVAALTGLLMVVEALGGVIADMINTLTGTDWKMPDLSSKMRELTEGLAQDTGVAIDRALSASAMLSVDNFFAGIDDRANQAAQKLLDKKARAPGLFDPALATAKTQKLKDTYKGPELVERRFSFDMPKQMGLADPMERMAKAGEAQAEQATKQTAVLERIASAVEDDDSEIVDLD